MNKKIYSYNAMTASGKEIKSKIEASNKNEALTIIKSLGYFPVSIKEIENKQPEQYKEIINDNMNEVKIYCKLCKWYKSEHRINRTDDFFCYHPKNFRKMNNWYESIVVNDLSPSIKNMHNDCKDFENVEINDENNEKDKDNIITYIINLFSKKKD